MNNQNNNSVSKANEENMEKSFIDQVREVSTNNSKDNKETARVNKYVQEQILKAANAGEFETEVSVFLAIKAKPYFDSSCFNEMISVEDKILSFLTKERFSFSKKDRIVETYDDDYSAKVLDTVFLIHW
jgi:hypothetical protein